MIVARTKAEVRDAVDRMRSAGERIAFVPTMGYLHRGHVSLLERASQRGDRLVISVFVNPLQFAPTEDLDRYPRDLGRDLGIARSNGVDLAFVPRPGEMYPDGPPETTVDPGPMAERLCGAHRPGHFRGVLTVVAKLFSIVGPDVALFGQKDFQQLVLIRRMVHDLDLDIEIDAAPILRESDGLAMSSRNALLSEAERTEAAGIYEALRALQLRFTEGESDPGPLLRALEAQLGTHGRLRLQYAEIVDPETLESVDRAAPGDVAAVAVFAGETRLIDNIVLSRKSERTSAGASAAAAGAAASGHPSTGDVPTGDATPHDVLPRVVRAAAAAEFPDWMRAGRERRAHMLRVAALMGQWAAALDRPREEVLRWKAAGILHDVLREEEPQILRSSLLDPLPELADLPAPLLHGPAAAVRLREEGVEDEALLTAITYHTTGHPRLGEMGRALFAADFLDPGRPLLRRWRDALRRRMPMAFDEVVTEILEAKIAWLAKVGSPIRPETRSFWAEQSGGRPLPTGDAARDPEGER